MRYLIFLFVISLSLYGSSENKNMLSLLYQQSDTLMQEVLIIKKHLGIEKKANSKQIKTKLLTRHTRARAYELFQKLNILRTKNSLPLVEAPNMEPTTELNPKYTYGQLERLLVEVRILKFHLGIKKTIKPSEIKGTKSVTDIYNNLGRVSAELDAINGEAFRPSHVFSESMRIYEDLEAILLHLNINDSTVPSSKLVDLQAKDSYKLALDLLQTLKTLEVQAGLDTIDFYTFERLNVTPSDVYEITQMVLAELQIIKAYIGLNHEITRGAMFYTDKSPSDVAQVLTWLNEKAKLIKNINQNGGR